MGTISLEHSDHLYWLGRYTERVYTTLRALQSLYDSMLDKKGNYTEFLNYFGLENIYEDEKSFMRSFLYDRANANSVAFSLKCAYDNGIVLREEISTEALSFLQMAKDTLVKSEKSANTRLSLLPLEDILFGFWGCISDRVYDDEIKNIIWCGKTVERLDLYLRMKYPYSEVKREFDRLCRNLSNIPENTPYCCNSKYFNELKNVISSEENYSLMSGKAMISLSHLFEAEKEVSA